MNNQILFIYESKSLFDIFSEIEDNLNFKVINLTKKEISQINFKDYRDYLILSLKDLKLPNLILAENFPMKLSKLLERINIEFLKKNFNQQSNVIVSKYTIKTGKMNSAVERPNQPVLNAFPLDFLKYLDHIMDD